MNADDPRSIWDMPPRMNTKAAVTISRPQRSRWEPRPWFWCYYY